MSEETAQPDRAEEDFADEMDDAVPGYGYAKVPVVGLGGSAGSIEALQSFFATLPSRTGLAYVVVIHLSPEHESMLSELLQRCTRMQVVQVRETLEVRPDTVYVIPPRKLLQAVDGRLTLQDVEGDRTGHVTVDLFFRTLADSHGPHAAAVVLSGMNGDGAIGIKRIKERGGLTISQDPEEAAHSSMPRTAIGTGMVDWVLPVQDMPARLLAYFRLEHSVSLPPEAGPEAEPGQGEGDEAQLHDVLNFLRMRTSRDFSHYKRATVLRRIGRRMQVNGVDNLPAYLNCLRTRPGECGALLQDLLISVTNFFRDPECFSALESYIPSLFEGKGPTDAVRVWVIACATGEEAYSLAMMLSEYARTLESPPLIQVFATDLDEVAVQAARDGVYPAAITADVNEERLRRFFTKEHRGYRVRRELREMVLFAVHDVLRDSPFSRQDLVTCRNLLIYLAKEAQARVFDTVHFSLVPAGKLFLGSSESVDDANPLFITLDKKHRIYQHRSTVRATMPALAPALANLRFTAEEQHPVREAPVVAGANFDRVLHAPPGPSLTRTAPGTRAPEAHLRLLEHLGPPSVLVDSEYEILHLSPSAGRFLQLSGGEPSRNLLRSVPAELRIELRAALFQAAQTGVAVDLPPVSLELPGGATLTSLRVVPAESGPSTLYLVMFTVRTGQGAEGEQQGVPLEADPLARHLDLEIDRLKAHLRDTVEQYEASTEELKASNEELQAMNEELRAATEELETSREELQSINEELTTVNHELKGKVDQLSHANSDMQNLMDATAIATVFLDRELRIMRYTPAAVVLFNLIPGDLGRPLTDMATQLEYPELGDDAQRVLQRLVPIEREVGQSSGNWYLARVIPYRTLDDRIAGIVFTFIDITERKQAEEMRLWLSAVVSSTSDAIISFALDQTILSWNSGAQKLFGYSAEEAIGQPLSILSRDGSGEQQKLLAQVAAGRAVENFETVRRNKDGADVHVAVTISPITDQAGHVMAATAMARDITAARAAAEALRQSEERLRLLVENVVEYAIFSTDLERRITIWNTGAQRLLGYTEQEAIGQSADVIFTPEDRAAGGPDQEARLAHDSGRAADERQHVRKDGSRFQGSGVLMLMRDGAGQAVGYVKILRDLASRPPLPAH
jgi:two-component system CheB/CheR fusion protein